jgi:hypothetical protein
LCVPADRAAALVDDLLADGLPAVRIGELRDGGGIELHA